MYPFTNPVNSAYQSSVQQQPQAGHPAPGIPPSYITYPQLGGVTSPQQSFYSAIPAASGVHTAPPIHTALHTTASTVAPRPSKQPSAAGHLQQKDHDTQVEKFLRQLQKKYKQEGGDPAESAGTGSLSRIAIEYGTSDDNDKRPSVKHSTGIANTKPGSYQKYIRGILNELDSSSRDSDQKKEATSSRSSTLPAFSLNDPEEYVPTPIGQLRERVEAYEPGRHELPERSYSRSSEEPRHASQKRKSFEDRDVHVWEAKRSHSKKDDHKEQKHQPDDDDDDEEYYQAQVFITHLPVTTTLEDMKDILKDYEKKMWIGYRKHQPGDKCVFVRVANMKEAKRLISEYNGYIFLGRTMELRFTAAADFQDHVLHCNNKDTSKRQGQPQRSCSRSPGYQSHRRHSRSVTPPLAKYSHRHSEFTKSSRSRSPRSRSPQLSRSRGKARHNSPSSSSQHRLSRSRSRSSSRSRSLGRSGRISPPSSSSKRHQDGDRDMHDPHMEPTSHPLTGHHSIVSPHYPMETIPATQGYAIPGAYQTAIVQPGPAVPTGYPGFVYQGPDFVYQQPPIFPTLVPSPAVYLPVYRVRIGNLSRNVTVDSLDVYIGSYNYSRLELDEADGETFALVDFNSIEEAERMMKDIHGKKCLGHTMRLKFISPSDQPDTAEQSPVKSTPEKPRSRDQSGSTWTRSPECGISMFQTYLDEQYAYAVVIGKKYISEFIKKEGGQAFYVCDVCLEFLVGRNIAAHVVGHNHQLSYCKRYTPWIYENLSKIRPRAKLEEACAHYAAKNLVPTDKIQTHYTEDPEARAVSHLRKLKESSESRVTKEKEKKAKEKFKTERRKKLSTEVLSGSSSSTSASSTSISPSSRSTTSSSDSTSDIFKRLQAYKQKLEALKETSKDQTTPEKAEEQQRSIKEKDTKNTQNTSFQKPEFKRPGKMTRESITKARKQLEEMRELNKKKDADLKKAVEEAKRKAKELVEIAQEEMKKNEVDNVENETETQTEIDKNVDAVESAKDVATDKIHPEGVIENKETEKIEKIEEIDLKEVGDTDNELKEKIDATHEIRNEDKDSSQSEKNLEKEIEENALCEDNKVIREITEAEAEQMKMLQDAKKKALKEIRKKEEELLKQTWLQRMAEEREQERLEALRVAAEKERILREVEEERLRIEEEEKQLVEKLKALEEEQKRDLELEEEVPQEYIKEAHEKLTIEVIGETENTSVVDMDIDEEVTTKTDAGNKIIQIQAQSESSEMDTLINKAAVASSKDVIEGQMKASAQSAKDVNSNSESASSSIPVTRQADTVDQPSTVDQLSTDEQAIVASLKERRAKLKLQAFGPNMVLCPDPRSTLQPALNDLNLLDKPGLIVGLGAVTEIWNDRPPHTNQPLVMFHCWFCSYQSGLDPFVCHLQGIKHKTRYMSKNHPQAYRKLISSAKGRWNLLSQEQVDTTLQDLEKGKKLQQFLLVNILEFQFYRQAFVKPGAKRKQGVAVPSSSSTVSDTTTAKQISASPTKSIKFASEQPDALVMSDSTTIPVQCSNSSGSNEIQTSSTASEKISVISTVVSSNAAAVTPPISVSFVPSITVLTPNASRKQVAKSTISHRTLRPIPHESAMKVTNVAEQGHVSEVSMKVDGAGIVVDTTSSIVALISDDSAPALTVSEPTPPKNDKKVSPTASQENVSVASSLEDVSAMVSTKSSDTITGSQNSPKPSKAIPAESNNGKKGLTVDDQNDVSEIPKKDGDIVGEYVPSGDEGSTIESAKKDSSFHGSEKDIKLHNEDGIGSDSDPNKSEGNANITTDTADKTVVLDPAAVKAKEKMDRLCQEALELAFYVPLEDGRNWVQYYQSLWFNGEYTRGVYPLGLSYITEVQGLPGGPIYKCELCPEVTLPTCRAVCNHLTLGQPHSIAYLTQKYADKLPEFRQSTSYTMKVMYLRKLSQKHFLQDGLDPIRVAIIFDKDYDEELRKLAMEAVFLADTVSMETNKQNAKFYDNPVAMKNVMIGTSYVTELQGLPDGVKFRCDLCVTPWFENFDSIYQHMISASHITVYLRKHARTALQEVKEMGDARTQVLQEVAKNLLVGKKIEPIKLAIIEDDSPPEDDYKDKTPEPPPSPGVKLYKMLLDSGSLNVVGLGSVIEIQGVDDAASPKYECLLCDTVTTSHLIVSHLTGAHHKFKFLKTKYPMLLKRCEGRVQNADMFVSEIVAQYGWEPVSKKKMKCSGPDGNPVYEEPVSVPVPFPRTTAPMEESKWLEKMNLTDKAILEESEKVCPVPAPVEPPVVRAIVQRPPQIDFEGIAQGLDYTPLLGIEFMQELRHPEELYPPMFECHLCNTDVPILHNKVIKHICTRGHRLNYFRKTDPIWMAERTGHVPQEDLDQHTKEVASKEMRKKMSKVILHQLGSWEKFASKNPGFIKQSKIHPPVTAVKLTEVEGQKEEEKLQKEQKVKEDEGPKEKDKEVKSQDKAVPETTKAPHSYAVEEKFYLVKQIAEIKKPLVWDRFTEMIEDLITAGDMKEQSSVKSVCKKHFRDIESKALGLKDIWEIQAVPEWKAPVRFICHLCFKESISLRKLRQHCINNQHALRYIKQNYPEIFKGLNETRFTSSELKEKIVSITAELLHTESTMNLPKAPRVLLDTAEKFTSSAKQVFKCRNPVKAAYESKQIPETTSADGATAGTKQNITNIVQNLKPSSGKRKTELSESATEAKRPKVNIPLEASTGIDTEKVKKLDEKGGSHSKHQQKHHGKSGAKEKSNTSSHESRSYERHRRSHSSDMGKISTSREGYKKGTQQNDEKTSQSERSITVKGIEGLVDISDDEEMGHVTETSMKDLAEVSGNLEAVSSEEESDEEDGAFNAFIMSELGEDFVTVDEINEEADTVEIETTQAGLDLLDAKPATKSEVLANSETFPKSKLCMAENLADSDVRTGQSDVGILLATNTELPKEVSNSTTIKKLPIKQSKTFIKPSKKPSEVEETQMDCTSLDIVAQQTDEQPGSSEAVVEAQGEPGMETEASDISVVFTAETSKAQDSIKSDKDQSIARIKSTNATKENQSEHIDSDDKLSANVHPDSKTTPGQEKVEDDSTICQIAFDVDDGDKEENEAGNRTHSEERKGNKDQKERSSSVVVVIVDNKKESEQDEDSSADESPPDWSEFVTLDDADDDGSFDGEYEEMELEEEDKTVSSGNGDHCTARVAKVSSRNMDSQDDSDNSSRLNSSVKFGSDNNQVECTLELEVAEKKEEKKAELIPVRQKSQKSETPYQDFVKHVVPSKYSMKNESTLEIQTEDVSEQEEEEENAGPSNKR